MTTRINVTKMDWPGDEWFWEINGTFPYSRFANIYSRASCKHWFEIFQKTTWENLSLATIPRPLPLCLYKPHSWAERLFSLPDTWISRLHLWTIPPNQLLHAPLHSLLKACKMSMFPYAFGFSLVLCSSYDLWLMMRKQEIVTSKPFSSHQWPGF